jgi:phage terminase Nu1 subunit (DNA packaging protein)
MARIVPADAPLRRLNQQQAAYILGVTSRSLRDWPDAPRNDDGTYDAAPLVAWWLERDGKHGAMRNSSEFDNQRERLAAAQAEKVETENRVRRGELADMADVSAAWQDHILAAKSKLLSMPAKLGPQLVNIADAGTIAGRIRAEVHFALLELAESSDVRSGGVAPEGTVGVESSTGPDGLGVG